MAKKKTTATKVVEKVVEQPVETVVAPPKTQVKKEVKPSWEIKDRVYYLTGNKKPISRSI